MFAGFVRLLIGCGLIALGTHFSIAAAQGGYSPLVFLATVPAVIGGAYVLAAPLLRS
jgi:hypothetical protein